MISITDSAQDDGALTGDGAHIRDFIPHPGDIVRVNVRAGCEKTATAALICNTILKRQPTARIAYFVFGKKAKQEATDSKKFKMENVCVMTTHAFAKKNVYPAPGQKMTGDQFSIIRFVDPFWRNSCPCGSQTQLRDLHNLQFFL